MSESKVQHLIASGLQSSQNGDHKRAAFCYQQALAYQPENPALLNKFANALLANGEAARAKDILDLANAKDPGQPALLFNLAAAARASGATASALAALDEALRIDPYFVQAIFQKAILLEEMGSPGPAAQVYRDFLDTVPPEVRQNPGFAGLIERAELAVKADDVRLEMLIVARATAPSLRMREAIDTLLNRQPIYVSNATFLPIPRLPAIPFLDRSMTPWIETLEAATPVIRREIERVLASDAAQDFSPYIANRPGIPLNQWEELDHSPRWGALFFWQHAKDFPLNHARFPETTKLLQTLPLLELAGRAPNAFLSRLEAKTRIPPHTGVTNARMTVHLPLIVPERCGFRVGAETRFWSEGTAWVFDDTIEHEAWNDSEEPRLILIFDIWNPMLDLGERAYITAALAAYDDHCGRRPFTE